MGTVRRDTASGWQQVSPSNANHPKRPLFMSCDGWNIEVPGEPLPLSSSNKSWQYSINLDGSTSEVPEAFFYRKYFANSKKTMNFLGSDPRYGSVAFSMCLSADACRASFYTKYGTRQVSLPTTGLKFSTASIRSRKQQMLQQVLPKLDAQVNMKNLRQTHHPDIHKELLSLEERQVCSGFKFGIVYIRAGQTDENDIFSNETGSEDWNEFLDLLGNRVALKGWSHYSAGLDVKGNTTGTHSLYTNWRGNEIMFHVSTMLPFHPDDPQKLERKRHVGNDICVVVFQDGNTPYLPATITSHFNHVIGAVQSDKAVNGYRVGFSSKEGVPSYGPPLPSLGNVKKDDLREFLLTKLINGETSSLLAPAFAQKLVRTREALLNFFVQQYM